MQHQKSQNKTRLHSLFYVNMKLKEKNGECILGTAIPQNHTITHLRIFGKEHLRNCDVIIRVKAHRTIIKGVWTVACLFPCCSNWIRWDARSRLVTCPRTGVLSCCSGCSEIFNSCFGGFYLSHVPVMWMQVDLDLEVLLSSLVTPHCCRTRFSMGPPHRWMLCVLKKVNIQASEMTPLISDWVKTRT